VVAQHLMLVTKMKMPDPNLNNRNRNLELHCSDRPVAEPE